MTDKTTHITEWLDETRAQGAKRVELHYRTDGSLVRTWTLAANANDNTPGPTSTEIAAQIVKRAEREGATQAAVRVTFTILAFVDGSDAYADRTQLIVDGANAKGQGAGGAGDAEESTPSAIIGTLVKMVGEQHRMLLSGQESRHVHAEQMIDRLSRENDGYRNERIKVWELVEAASSAQLEREQKQQQLRLASRRDDFLFEKLSMIAPIALNRLMGGGPGKGSPFFGEEMVRQFLSSLTPGQVDGMLKNQPLALSPDQLGLIAELTLAYEQRERQRRPLNADGTPVAADANGVDASSKGPVS